jgi:DNA-binding response OmpR family regulator
VALQIRDAWPRAARQPRIIMLSAESPEAMGRARPPVRTDCFLVKPVSTRRLRAAIAGQAHETLAPAALAIPDTMLQHLFREELASRLDALDGCLAGRDLVAARAILHQLIASSRLCRQRRLERTMLALHRACHASGEAEKLGRRYYALLAAAREYLQAQPASRQDPALGFRSPG